MKNVITAVLLFLAMTAGALALSPDKQCRDAGFQYALFNQDLGANPVLSSTVQTVNGNTFSINGNASGFGFDSTLSRYKFLIGEATGTVQRIDIWSSGAGTYTPFQTTITSVLVCSNERRA